MLLQYVAITAIDVTLLATAIGSVVTAIGSVVTVLSAIVTVVTATYCYPTTSVPIVTFMTLFIFTAYSLYLISC